MTATPDFEMSLRRKVLAPVHAFSEVVDDPNLRRILLASAGYVTSEWAYSVALAVYAFRSGGATAVGVVGLLRMLPAAVAAPFGSLLADRRRRERVLTLVYALRAAMLAASAAALYAGASRIVVFVLAAGISIVSAMLRPVQWSLLPLLAQTPEQLTASNSAQSLVEGASVLVAPAVAGALLVTTSPAAVFAVSAGVVVVSIVLAARIRTEFLAPRDRGNRPSLARQALDGFRAIATNRDPRLLVALGGAQTLVRGALNVLVVVVAIDLLKMGDSGVGYLNSAFGVGGLLGAVVALALVGRRRLASPLALGLILWGVPIALVGIFPSTVAALVLLAVPGLGNAIFDIAVLTLLQRTVPNDVLGRVLGVLEGVVMVSVGIGSIVAPPLIHWLGVKGALVATGAFLPALTVATWPRLQAMDARTVVPERELALLRPIPLFAPLPAVALEHLASSMTPVQLPAGTTLFAEGDRGDRFYVLVEGECEITARGRPVAHREPGDYFGEIALLRDVPRTATVTASTDALLYAIDRDDFLAAVTGHVGTVREADSVVGERLEGLGAILED